VGRTLASVIGVVALAFAFVGAAVAEPAPQSVALSGKQITIDEKTGKYEMQGSLVGKWLVTAFTPQYASASQVVGVGKERFVGCLDASRNGTCDAGEPAGTLRMSFTFWATLDPTKKTPTMLRGDCVHPILGGTGAFAKAKGVVFMKDRPAKTGEILTTYRGTLEYGAQATSSVSQTRTLSSRSARGGCGG
jgi:hypothetical protein